MTDSHKTECRSYAVHVAEQTAPGSSALETDILATCLLSDGTVSCICGDLPP